MESRGAMLWFSFIFFQRDGSRFHERESKGVEGETPVEPRNVQDFLTADHADEYGFLGS
jgi:hypothetical protein